MKIYDTYQEAKIENPDCDIYVLEKKTALMRGKFQPMSNAPTDHFCNGWRLCKPVDYLPSLEWFFDEGHKLVVGDVFIIGNDELVEVGKNYHGVIVEPQSANYRVPSADSECYVLRAAALSEIKVITETPEEREALDMIDTTSKQVDGLAKGDSVEWKNGDNLEYIDGDGEWSEFLGRYISFDKYAGLHVIYASDGNIYHAESEQIRKPESQEQKQIKSMVGDFRKYSGSLFYADMAKYLIDLGWSKEQ